MLEQFEAAVLEIDFSSPDKSVAELPDVLEL